MQHLFMPCFSTRFWDTGDFWQSQLRFGGFLALLVVVFPASRLPVLIQGQPQCMRAAFLAQLGCLAQLNATLACLTVHAFKLASFGSNRAQ